MSTLKEYLPDLAVFHWISYDSGLVLDFLRERRVPYVVVNHFDNARLTRRYIKRQISGAKAIGGVSKAGVPGFLSDSFINLSDGIDTDFFKASKAVPLAERVSHPLLFLPSRIIEGKGHMDAVSTLERLRDEGIMTNLVFAGRQDSVVLLKKLVSAIEDRGIAPQVTFAGELKPEEIRNWFAASDAVILPSYSEGLPKVLLEAQAMEKPVVAYDTGGVSETLRDGETGYLVKKGCRESLADRLQRILGDGALRDRMGKAGRRFIVDRFSMSSLFARHEDFYLQNLGR